MMAPPFSTHAQFVADMKSRWQNSAFPHRIFRWQDSDLAPPARGDQRAFTSLLDLRAVASAAVRFFRFDTMQGGILAMAGQCFVCGNPVAPFGFGWPGFHSEKPKGKRGYLWTCSEHRQEGERRREEGIAAYYGRAKPKPQTTTPTEEEKGSKE